LLAWWGAVSGSFESKLVRFLRVGWRGCVFGSGWGWESSSWVSVGFSGALSEGVVVSGMRLVGEAVEGMAVVLRGVRVRLLGGMLAMELFGWAMLHVSIEYSDDEMDVFTNSQSDWLI
jgi:hypothetical protein